MRLLSLLEADHSFHRLEPPQEDMKAWLEQMFGNEANYGGLSSDDQESTLASGEPWAFCTSWAKMVKQALPDRTEVYGFWDEDNPGTEIGDTCGGHDFAVVDNRYIVDGWAKNVETMTNRAVFDLEDVKDRQIIQRLYGNPNNWNIMD